MAWALRQRAGILAKLLKVKIKVPQTPVQGSDAHEPLLSREATSHSLTAMLVWSCRLKMWTQKVLHVRSTRTKATVRGDHMSLFREGKEEDYILFCSCQCRLAETRVKQKAMFHLVTIHLQYKANSRNKKCSVQSGRETCPQQHGQKAQAMTISKIDVRAEIKNHKSIPSPQIVDTEQRRWSFTAMAVIKLWEIGFLPNTNIIIFVHVDLLICFIFTFTSVHV